MKKYEFVQNDTVEVNGHTLHRIRALIDIPGVVCAGELGGYIEKEENLEHSEKCWVQYDAWVYDNASVFDDAHVYGNARVTGNALVYGNARVYGNAWIFGHAQVAGHARVYDNALVSGESYVLGKARVFSSAEVYGNARVHGNAKISGVVCIYGDAVIKTNAVVAYSDDIIWFSNVGSERGTLTAYKTKTGVHLIRGCFSGTLTKFEAAVNKTHGNNQYAAEYKALIAVIKIRFGVK